MTKAGKAAKVGLKGTSGKKKTAMRNQNVESLKKAGVPLSELKGSRPGRKFIKEHTTPLFGKNR